MCKIGYEKMVKSLIDQGADMNKTKKRDTPLNIESRNGNETVVKYLVEHCTM